MREAGFGVKAATVTPEGKDDVGSPNRILREEVDGKVIIRTGRRIPGVTPIAGVHHPISVVRMAVEDAYGAKQWREGTEGAPDEVAYRTEKITRSTCRAVAEYAFRTAGKMGGKVYGGPKWTVSPVYEGMLKEELDAAAARNPDVTYEPVLIDATYAGLISSPPETPLVIPALNRDGDCLSDLVMPMFGSIAGAESVLLAFDEDFETQVAMAEAPHGTAPALQGKDVANPMAMILACGAVLHYAGVRGHAGAERAVAGDLRVGPRGDRGRRAHARPGRPRHHIGLHQRGRRARAHEDRRLVLAGHHGLAARGVAAATSLAAPRFRPTPGLGSRTHVLPCLEPPAGLVLMARDRPARRRPGRRLRHARELHHRPRPLVGRLGCGLHEREPARSRRRPRAPSAPRAPERPGAARACRDGPRADPLLRHAPPGASAAPQRASLRALTGLGGPPRTIRAAHGERPVVVQGRSEPTGPAPRTRRPAARGRTTGRRRSCRSSPCTRIEPGLSSSEWA